MWGGHSPQLLGFYDFITYKFYGGRDREEDDWWVLMLYNYFFIICLLPYKNN